MTLHHFTDSQLLIYYMTSKNIELARRISALIPRFQSMINWNTNPNVLFLKLDKDKDAGKCGLCIALNDINEGNKDYERRKHNKRYNVTDNSQVFHDYLDDWEKICLNMHL